MVFIKPMVHPPTSQWATARLQPRPSAFISLTHTASCSHWMEQLWHYTISSSLLLWKWITQCCATTPPILESEYVGCLCIDDLCDTNTRHNDNNGVFFSSFCQSLYCIRPLDNLISAPEDHSNNASFLYTVYTCNQFTLSFSNFGYCTVSHVTTVG